MNLRNIISGKTVLMAALLAAAALPQGLEAAGKGDKGKFVHTAPGNPYLPLWEHLPDGEPRVFEDPDRPGKYRAYIVGSHDVSYKGYCGSDIRIWSAPVEDLSSWRDEGPAFTFKHDGKWDIMFAPDLVEVREKDGSKTYYLYPHSRGAGREALVTKGKRPDGPFEPVNLDEATGRALHGSILGFDPSIYVEQITDPADPDYATGYRAYGFWGFQRSLAAQLDPKTMYSLRPGTELIPYLLPAGKNYGTLRQPEQEYPCIYPGEDLGKFNFFEASSIRKVGNKYVTVYSGYSGPDYGLGSSNSTLRYAYADSPLGPWKIGGVVVDSRAPELGTDGMVLRTTNGGHNTHGSIEQINGQWYVFYHRPPRNFGFARQAMVAPIKVEYDEKSVADGGKVRITGFDPYTSDKSWSVKDSKGNHYTGAEVTSEGFHFYGLDPYRYYPAGIACYLTNVGMQQDSWDIWDNNAPVAGFGNGDAAGFKYFGFGGLDKAQYGLKPFKGSRKGDRSTLNLFVKPRTDREFKINVWLDAPGDKGAWKGTRIAQIAVPASSAQEVTNFKADVSAFVDNLDKKHSLYVVAEGAEGQPLFDLVGLGFSRKGKSLERPCAPKVFIQVNGKDLAVPELPVRMTPENGITGYDIYELDCAASPSGKHIITAGADNKDVKVEVVQPSAPGQPTEVKFDYKGVVKTYRINFKAS